MNLLLRNVPVLLVFLTMAAFGWLWGGGRPSPQPGQEHVWVTTALMPAIPWLYALLFEALLFFPQRRPYEDAVSARRRCWHALRRDPLLYVSLVFVLLLVIPFVNHMSGGVAEPPASFAPFCVDVERHFEVLLWFLPTLTAMLAAKHALLRQGKRALMEMLVWNAAALAVLGFIQQATGAEFPFWTKPLHRQQFFSTFGYPNMAGSFFVMAFAFSVGLWQHRVTETAAQPRDVLPGKSKEHVLHRWLRAHYPLAAVLLNFFGALCTLSRAAVLLLFVLAALAFLYYECSMLFARHERTRRIKNAAFGLGGGLLFLLAFSVFAPADLGKELKTLSGNGVADRVTGKDQYHVRVATEVFKDHPFFGVGGWGYGYFGTLKVEELLGRLTEEKIKTIVEQTTATDPVEPSRMKELVGRAVEDRIRSLMSNAATKKLALRMVKDLSGDPPGDAAAQIAAGAECQAAVEALARLLLPNPDDVRERAAMAARIAPLIADRISAVAADADFLKQLEPLDRQEQLVRVAGQLARALVADPAVKEGIRVSAMTTLMQMEGGANVHNDYVQFLCEHGAVGALLLLGIFLLLVSPVFVEWFRLYRAARFTKADKAPPKPTAIYSIPPGALWILLGDAAVLVHAFGDCPLRSAAVLSFFFVSLACAEGYLPREQGGRR